MPEIQYGGRKHEIVNLETVPLFYYRRSCYQSSFSRAYIILESDVLKYSYVGIDSEIMVFKKYIYLD